MKKNEIIKWGILISIIVLILCLFFINNNEIGKVEKVENLNDKNIVCVDTTEYYIFKKDKIKFTTNDATNTGAGNWRLYMEAGYYAGQKEALNDDIRIDVVNGEYVWIKSPWDNHTGTFSYYTIHELDNIVFGINN